MTSEHWIRHWTRDQSWHTTTKGDGMCLHIGP